MNTFDNCIVFIRQKPSTQLPKVKVFDPTFVPSNENPYNTFIASLPLTDVFIEIFCVGQDENGNLKTKEAKQITGQQYTGVGILNILDLLVKPIQSKKPGVLRNGTDLSLIETLDIGVNVSANGTDIGDIQFWTPGNRPTNIIGYSPTNNKINLIFKFKETGTGSTIKIGPPGPNFLDIQINNGAECFCLCNNSFNAENINTIIPEKE